MKTLLACSISQSSRNPCPRAASRSTPGLSRQREYTDIRVLEKRSRGLRLYVAWVSKTTLPAFAKLRSVGNCLELLPEPFTDASALLTHAHDHQTETTCFVQSRALLNVA